MKNVLQLKNWLKIRRRIKMYSTAISRGSKITSALSSLSLKPGNGNFWGGRPRFCGKIRDQIAFSCPRVSPVRKLMTMSQRKIVSETTLKMILMSRSWGRDAGAPSQVPRPTCFQEQAGWGPCLGGTYLLVERSSLKKEMATGKIIKLAISSSSMQMSQ